MNEIPLLQPGGRRTLLSASVANDLIRGLNAIRRMRGRNGVRVVIADGGIVVEGDGTSQAPVEGGGGGGSGGGGLIWGGEWNGASIYDAGTIVIRSSESALADGNIAGSYISKIDVPGGSPGPNEAGGSTYWETFAQYSSDVFVCSRGDTEIRIDVRASVGLPEIVIESNRALHTGARVVISLDDLAGKYARFIEVDVCDAGVAKKMLVLGTDPYIP